MRGGHVAHVIGADPRLDMAAWALLSPSFGSSVHQHTYWTGVSEVPPGSRLQFGPGPGSRITRWWNAPEPELSIAEGAPELLARLREAISLRVQGRDVVSADLSGGMDSTSLCFLINEEPARLLTYVQHPEDRAHDDAAWAAEASTYMDNEHVVFGHEDLPQPYDGVLDASDCLRATFAGLEEPYTLVRNLTRKQAMARRFAADGSALHVTGFGGDELFTATGAHLNDLYRSRPLMALRRARSMSRLRRWPLAEVVAQVRDATLYRDWLAHALRDVRAPHSRVGSPNFGWGARARLPVWATSAAEEGVRAIIEPLLPTAEPTDPRRRSVHLTVSGLRIGGQRLGPLRRLMEREGVALSMPYMDDRVLEAVLRVDRFEDTTAPSYKPLLREAMRPLPTGRILERVTKGEFSKEVYDGIARNRAQLLTLFADSLLPTWA